MTLNFIRILTATLAATLELTRAQKLAPLEFADSGNSIYLGAWYDRLNGDTPQAMNQRLNHKPLSFFQMDVNITQTLQSAEIDTFVSHMAATNTQAFLYLTIYPYEGFDVVSDSALADLVAKVKAIVASGQKMLIRYASEMNGSWFVYGQAPTAFKASWKRVVGAIRNGTNNSSNIAFLWSPNSGGGYPYSGYGILPPNRPFDRALDTNGNGRLDNQDDPYTPYYPGDDWVDWVGISIYHYGNTYPYNTNDIPAPNKFETALSGGSAFNYYQMFSVTRGKPFFVSETGSTVHVEIVDKAGNWSPIPKQDATTRAAVKQAWWRQFINKQLLQKYPKLKGVSFFEFTKREDETIRDFTNLGSGYKYTTPLKQDAMALDNSTLSAFQADMRGELGSLVLWATGGTPSTTTTSSPTASATVSATGSAKNSAVSAGGAKGILTVLALVAAVFV